MTSSTSNNDALDPSHRIVKSTIRDLFEVQQSALDRVRFKTEQEKSKYVLKTEFDEVRDKLASEKLNHTKTKLLLDEEKERTEFIKNENEILRQQLAKYKEEYESTIKSLQNKATRETKRCNFLIEKCSEAEQVMMHHQEMLQVKEDEIIQLKKRLKTQKDNHKHTLQEIDIAKMQENYLLKTLSDSERKKFNS